MKTMKTRTGMKVAKSMKKGMRAMKSMRVSKIAKGSHAKSVVFAGRKEKTISGLTKEMLTKSKRGKIVSKKQQARGRKAYQHISGWTKAVQQAKKALGIEGFVIVGGTSPVGKALYAKAKSLYKQE